MKRSVAIMIAVIGCALIGLSIFSPEGIKAFGNVASNLIWPAVLVFLISKFQPQFGNIFEKLEELDAFGIKAKLTGQLKKAELEVPTNGGLSEHATVRQIERAVEVDQMVGDNERIVQAEVVRLAQEYQSLRIQKPPGDDRTREMELIVAKMRTIALAAYKMRYRLSVSADPGERLQAVACLQVQSDFDMLDWLADRIEVEKPFIGYHASVALNGAGADPLAIHQTTALKKALETAEKAVEPLGERADRRLMVYRFRSMVRKLKG